MVDAAKDYMKYKETLFLEWIFTSNCITKLENCTRPIMRNLMKLRLLPDSDECNTWREEISSYLYEVDKLEPDHCYPSSEFIMQYTYFFYKADMDTLIKNVITDNNINSSNEWEIYTIKLDIMNYFEWLSEKLEKYGSLSKKDIKNKLEKLKF